MQQNRVAFFLFFMPLALLATACTTTSGDPSAGDPPTEDLSTGNPP